MGLTYIIGQIVNFIIIPIAFFIIVFSWLILPRVTGNRRYDRWPNDRTVLSLQGIRLTYS